MAVFQMLLPLSGSNRHKPKTGPHWLHASATAFKATARSGVAPEFNFRPHTEDYFPSGAAAAGAAPPATPRATPSHAPGLRNAREGRGLWGEALAGWVWAPPRAQSRGGTLRAGGERARARSRRPPR